ncbi:MAG: hypothetical protein MPJ06_09245 [Nitrosopumilus sp.]|nr:hypothetical protein [Nitrosopumilus sp.]
MAAESKTVNPRPAHTVALLAALAALVPGALITHAASPHAQFEAGVPLEEIECGEDLVLLESPRGRPACVTEGSAGRLVQRGFEEVVPVVTGRDVVVPGATWDVPDIPSSNVAGAPPDAAPGDDADTGPPDAGSRDTSPADVMEIMKKMRGSEPVILSGVESLEDEAERLGLIPDERYEYTIKMPLEDPDAFVHGFVEAVGDRVIEKTDGEAWPDTKYVTEHGFAELSLNYGKVVGVTYVVGSTSHDEMDAFFLKILDGLGICPDETEIDYSPFVNHKYDVPDPGYPVIHVDQKWKSGPDKGFDIFKHSVHFEFEDDTTEVFIDNWISDSDKFELYSFNLAKLIAHEYLVNYDDLKKDDCGYVSSVAHVRGEIDILAGRPVYEIRTGTCTVPYKTEMFMDGPHHFYRHFVVYVDAVTGEPLFASKEKGNATWNRLHTRGVIP